MYPCATGSVPTANTIGRFLLAFIAAVVTGCGVGENQLDLILLKLLRHAFDALGVALEILDSSTICLPSSIPKLFQPRAQPVGYRPKHAAQMDHTNALGIGRLLLPRPRRTIGERVNECQ